MFRVWGSGSGCLRKKNEKGVVCVLLSRREWFVRKKRRVCLKKKYE